MTALFIGRFQPFHIGHLDALLQIQDKCDFIKIGIGSSKKNGTEKNPFDYKTRKKMIESLIPQLKSQIETFEIPDIDNDEEWVKYVQQIVGDFDIVYSGNDHVIKLFSKENIFTKKQIFNVNINATKIREMIKNGNDYSKYLTNDIYKIVAGYNL